MKKKWLLIVPLAIMLLFAIVPSVDALSLPDVSVDIGDGDGEGNGTSSLTILLLITVISIAPALLIMMTSFTRIVIVLGFLKTALGTNNFPPAQVLVGLAMFLTFFIMAPTINTINEVALQPYIQGEINQDEAFSAASKPIKEFMIEETREKDLLLFLNYTGAERPESIDDLSLTVLIPAYAISELKTAFQMGFMIYIPFLVIDMIVASVLMSMGMMMLPPIMISLPFKILLFVLVDGWNLVVRSLLLSFGT